VSSLSAPSNQPQAELSPCADGFCRASPACERAVMETVEALKKQGHECVEFAPHDRRSTSRPSLAKGIADGAFPLLQPSRPSSSLLESRPLMAVRAIFLVSAFISANSPPPSRQDPPQLHRVGPSRVVALPHRHRSQATLFHPLPAYLACRACHRRWRIRPSSRFFEGQERSRAAALAASEVSSIPLYLIKHPVTP